MTPEEQMYQDLELLRKNMEISNEKWNIEDSDIKSRKPVIGILITFFKRVIRKSIYWFIRPYWDQQIAFNSAVSCAIADLYRLQTRLLQSTCDMDKATNSLLHTDESRVFQLVSSLNFGDAVGNEVIAFKQALKENGYVTEIYTNHIHNRIPAGTACFYRDMPMLKENDIVIYHFASECGIAKDIKDFPCKVVLRYHNVTPPEFFHKFDANAEKATAIGLRQVKEIQPYIDYCLPVSDFNKSHLVELGYTCPMQVLPILIRFEDYKQVPDENVIKKYADGITNILFVGRVAPNKKFEDVISCFAYYKEHYDPTARLFLVGSFQETDKYYQFLQQQIQELDVKDVIFPGHISFAAILAYYNVSHIFLCMSEHEGFGVPLVEAMYFGVPIVAYDSSAVGTTLAGSGVLLNTKDSQIVAAHIVEAKKNKTEIVHNQKFALQSYDKKLIQDKLIAIIKDEIA